MQKIKLSKCVSNAQPQASAAPDILENKAKPDTLAVGLSDAAKAEAQRLLDAGVDPAFVMAKYQFQTLM